MKLQYSIHLTIKKLHVRNIICLAFSLQVLLNSLPALKANQEDQQIYFFQRINARYTGLNFSAKCNQELTYISKQIQWK